MTIQLDLARMVVRARSYAKLNLFFEVLHRRADGYHEVQSATAPISLHDYIFFDLKASFHTPVPVPFVETGSNILIFNGHGAFVSDIPVDQRNLVVRAYDAFYTRLASYACERFEQCVCAIRLYKGIPSQAGLGGGSSDAATTLRTLNALSPVKLPKDELYNLAASLGSDVPLFLATTPTIGYGRGEILQPFEAPSVWTVIVKPNYGFSTPAIFQEFKNLVDVQRVSLDDFRDRAAHAYQMQRRGQNDYAQELGHALFNRLEECALLRYPSVRRQRRLLEFFRPCGVAMTGSGSCFYAIFPTRERACQVARRLRRTLFQTRDHDFIHEGVFVAQSFSSTDLDKIV
ncbi:MAG: 4-(cytidine 5'-diphospho)-2-C-methyl-D-erythritol kinase [Planctomycetia bacterium]|nr:4-(cytidine 5'-diphospho)-2-C-methyl-D-erythritol kinase [Planctomycetia bacterium]